MCVCCTWLSMWCTCISIILLCLRFARGRDAWDKIIVIVVWNISMVYIENYYEFIVPWKWQDIWQIYDSESRALYQYKMSTFRIRFFFVLILSLNSAYTIYSRYYFSGIHYYYAIRYWIIHLESIHSLGKRTKITLFYWQITLHKNKIINISVETNKKYFVDTITSFEYLRRFQMLISVN